MARFPDKRALRVLYDEGATPAELVKALRVQAGSHDKLAAALREQGSKASRSPIIRWEKGHGMKEPNAAAFASLTGLPVEAFFRPPLPAPELLAQAAARLEAAATALVSVAERLDQAVRRLDSPDARSSS